MSLALIGGLASAIGGLFGKKSKSSETFERDSTVTQNATAQDLSDPLLQALEALFQSSLESGGVQQGQAALGAQLERVLAQAAGPEFDVNSFVNNVMAAATSGAQLDLESSTNKLLSDAGGASATGNSMAALLANRLQNNTASALAGAGAEARATGEGILRANRESSTNQVAGLSDGLIQSILGVVEQTRGASTKGSSTTVEKTKGKGNSSGTQGGGAGGFFSGLGSFFGNMNNAGRNA